MDRDRFRGALLGLAVGDAIGTTVEFSAPGTFPPVRDMVGGGPFSLPAGAWTDDTSMALCLAESLVERRVFDPVDQLERYLRWYREGRWSSTGRCFDIGNATRAALERFERTHEPFPGDAAPDAAGNGPLMKLAPVVLAYASRPDEAERYAGESARTTHGAVEAVDACRWYARLLLAALRGGELPRPRPQGAAHDEAAGAGGARLHPKVLATATSTREPPAVRGGGYVIDALEAALWALRSTTTFEDGVLAAVNLGDDADTTAAIYGQLAGALHGLEGIPARWRERVHLREEILAFADALYDLDRSRPAIARYAHVRPRAVVACETPEQVADALRTSGEIAIRSGGHCFAGRSSTTGTLIDISPMRAVGVDGGLATIGAGARLGDVYDALAARGRTIVAGCGPTVGIAGLLLGGGIGVLGRRHGLTSDQLVSAQVVLADGRIVECDAERHPDLFWALRGAGGGRFGVVTRLTLRTLPAERTTVFDIVLPRDPALVADWQDWAPHAPEELAASLLVLDDAAHLFGAYVGPREAAEEHLARFGGRRRIEELEFRAAKQWLADNGPDDGVERPFSRSAFFARPLPETPPLDCKLDFMPLAGAFSRVAAEATAYAHRDALFCLHLEAVDRPTVDRAFAQVQPYSTGGVYPNFPEPERHPWDPAYHLGNRERLLDIRGKYDPDGRFSPAPS